MTSRRADAAIFALALVPRLAFLGWWESAGLAARFPPDAYHLIAKAWLGWQAHGIFDAMLPPLYSLFLTALFALQGSPGTLLPLLLHCLMGAASAVLVRRVALTLRAGETPALLAALWVAVDPPLIFFTPQLQTETPFTFMSLLLFSGLLPRWDDRPGAWTAGLGLWAGLCALLRSSFAGYPAFLLAAVWRAKGARRAALFGLLLAAGWALPVGAWTLRNWLEHRRVVPMSAQMGWTMWEGFTLDRDEVRRRPHDMLAEAKAAGLSEPDFGAHFKAKTAAFVRADPLGALKIVLGKALLFWRPVPYDPYTGLQRALLGGYNVLLFALALLGVREALRSGGAWAPVWAYFAQLTFVHSLFLTTLRYRVPLQPFLIILASLGLARMAAGRRPR